MAAAPIEFDHVVIGAGVVGLAIARRLALAGGQTLLLESEARVGRGISSRNSEVIHAGIYYPPGSLKAELCVRGKALLYEYCAGRSVAHRRIGKLLVAADASEVAALEAYAARAAVNGVDDLRMITAAEALQMEPALQCNAALYSPGTGIIDTHGLMFALLTDFEQAGGVYVSRSPVLRGAYGGERIMLEVGGAEPFTVVAPSVINSAGLQAQAVARSIEGIRIDAVPPLYYAIGHYFSLSGKTPFSRLIYPMPRDGMLGVHLTLDLAGRARFGPDVSWRANLDYTFDVARGEAFYAAIRRYFPVLKDGALQPDYTGIRPKLVPQGRPDADFMVQAADAHGVPGLINLFGIESPGLTSALALAELVEQRARL